eukprot:7346956-Alexandrium_andersonii.AAC.1
MADFQPPVEGEVWRGLYDGDDSEDDEYLLPAGGTSLAGHAPEGIDSAGPSSPAEEARSGA